MTNAEMAALVAQALELRPGINNYSAAAESGEVVPLAVDGSNIFSAHWFQRCTLWLLDYGHIDFYEFPSASRWLSHAATGPDNISIICPASEFPARAVAQIMKERE